MKIKFINNLHEVLIFSAFILSILTLARVGNLLIFGDWQDLGQSVHFLDELFFRGLRFDLKLLASILILVFWLPVLLFSWLLSDKIFSLFLHSALKAFLLIVVFLVFVDIGYIFYFQKPIDVVIFGLLEDDTSAVISTIADDFNLLTLVVGFIVTVIVTLRLFSKLLVSKRRKIEVTMGAKAQLLGWFVSFLLVFILARGSFDIFPLQRKQASVSGNTFLNQMVMNSGFNLYYAYHDKAENNQEIFKQDILKPYKFDNTQQLITAAGYDEKSPLLRVTAVNEFLEKNQVHVIFVLMEGWSSQIALAQSKNNNVLGEFAKHAKEDYFYTRFFSNQYATNPTIEALLINSPITPLSQSVANDTEFRLSNVLPFKNKGYQIQFISGGYSSWRNHNSFWLKQGFDKYIGRSHIENYFDIDAGNNPWGVYDEYVFKYLKQTLLAADSKNRVSFNFVLTTNNHPPVRLPAYYTMPKLDLTVYGIEKGDKKKLSMLAGFHYQTDQLGYFLSWLKNSELKDRVIVVATGDHPLRAFSDNKSNTKKFLHYSVPAYFYIPEKLDKLKLVSADISGSHNDLFPTIYELSLSNSSYYNFGQPIMEKYKVDAFGWTEHGGFIFSDGIADSINKRFYPWAVNSKSLLSSEALMISEERLKIIRRESYRAGLRKHLIIQDYQQQKNK